MKKIYKMLASILVISMLVSIAAVYAKDNSDGNGNKIIDPQQ